MSEKCNQGEKRRLRRETLQRFFEEKWVSFHINAETLPPPEAFQYLGRTIAYNKSDWALVYLNLWKTRRRWFMVVMVLKSAGATVQAWGEMYKALAQSVLLYGIKNWVVTG